MKHSLTLCAALTAFLTAGDLPAAAQDAGTWNFLPGQFAITTPKDFYVTAVNAGGRSSDPTVITSAATAGAWEKFRIGVLDPAPTNDKAFQTGSGNYLTAVSGGGRTSDVLHTDATEIRDWERFRILDLSEGGVAPTWFALQTINGRYLTAVGQGGKYDNAFHSDATALGSWEHLRIVKCGDLGSDYQYNIIAANGQVLTAPDGGGRHKGDEIVEGFWPGDTPDRSWSRFKLIRQPDGSYALQTANGANFVTALGGGGLVQKYLPPDCGLFEACIAGFTSLFHTDATQVQGWERFNIVDQGNCKYTIQTVSGFYVGLYQDSGGRTLMTTRRSVISPNEMFQFVMHGLASPVVLR